MRRNKKAVRKVTHLKNKMNMSYNYCDESSRGVNVSTIDLKQPFKPANLIKHKS